MTQIEFRWIYNFRLAYDLLLGRIRPRGYGSSHEPGRVDPRSEEYIAARDCHADTLLRPFGLSPYNSRRALNELYELTDDELLAELLELRDMHRQEVRAARERRMNDGTESAETPFHPPARTMSPAQLLAQVHRARSAIQANPGLYGRAASDDDDGDDDTEIPRVDRRGRPVVTPRGRPPVTMPPPQDDDDEYVEPARPAGWPNRLTEDVDASYVRMQSALNRKNKKTGIPDPPKPAKPKPKRRLVVGRKRPPVVED